MKKLKQFLVVEADKSLPSLLSRFAPLLHSFSQQPVVETSYLQLEGNHLPGVDLIFYHAKLNSPADIASFEKTLLLIPSSYVVVVNEESESELCFDVLDAGARDCISIEQLTSNYVRKAVLLCGRYNEHEKYYGVFNEVHDAILVIDKSGKVLDVNNSAGRLLKYGREEILQSGLDDLFLQENDFFNVTDKPFESLMARSDGSAAVVELKVQALSNGRRMIIAKDISERKKTIEALSTSRQQLELIFDNTADVIFLLSVEKENVYRFVTVNQSFLSATGLQTDQVVGRLVSEVIPEPSLSLVLENYRTAIREKRTVEWEEVTDYPAGQKTGIVYVTPIFNKKGMCTQMLGTVHDITERKRAEMALLQSEEKYKSLVEQQADAIAVFDEGGRILDVNTSATQLLNYSREQLKDMNLMSIFSHQDESPFQLDALAGGESIIRQKKMRRKEGSLLEAEVHAKKLLSGLFIASIRDLTERLEVQNRLSKEIELSNSIINSLPGLFYLFTKDGRYIRWNKQKEILSGYSTAEIRNMSPLDFFDDDEKPAIIATINETFEKGNSFVEANMRTKDGRKIPFYFTGIAINYGNTDCLLGTGLNLSPLRNLEAKLSEQKIVEQKKIMQAMIEAEEKEKNKLGLELHDNVNQILSVVRMYLSILNSPDPMPEVTLDKTIKLLNNAIEEIRFLSHSLAVSYKFEAGLSDALQTMINNIQVTKDFAIELNIVPLLDQIINDNQKLAIYRIVQEQLNNIIKYARAGIVKISIGITEKDIWLIISDDGKGFDPAKPAKGLGLNTMINRAEALGGKITINSAPEKGCRLEATIPLQA